jgi:glyoxylase-like metal-dependent hydrolase (beta-lactamase superfamily II)
MLDLFTPLGSLETDLTVRRFESDTGAQIFQLPLLVFPGLWGYAYLALLDHQDIPYRVLIDAGSGFGESNQHLESGLRAVGELTGRPLSLEDLTHILITHGHIDHFGGLTYVRQRTQASLGVHELDLRNLANHEERLAVVAQRLETFLIEAGVPEEWHTQLLDLYKLTKSLYRSIKVDFTYEAVGMRLGPFEMLHVPGHCAGHVAIRLYDVLFSGDHVLAQISPHQSPEHLTLSTGLDHYLRSLEHLRAWAGGVRLTLGGHNAPILDLPTRLDEIHALHANRLQQVLDQLDKPRTIAEVSHILFGKVHGFNVLLALEETGAHIEYLYQRGLLAIENLGQVEQSKDPIPILYTR